MKIPTDVKEMTEKFKIDKGGICGQSCLAVIERITIEQVLKDWKKLGLEFKGWSGWKQLKEYLEKKGHEVKLKKKDVIFNKDYFYILRIQWLGEKENKEKPFYGWGHWTEASAHTHFIVVNNGEVFCNEDGLFKLRFLNTYFNGEAVITSAMEISQSNENTEREEK